MTCNEKCEHPLENPASSRRGKCRPDALTECGEIIKRTRTYRARADGCGAGAGRITTMGRAPHDDESIPRDDGYAERDDGSVVPDEGSATRVDG